MAAPAKTGLDGAPGPRRPWWFPTLAVVLSVLLVALVAEVALRLGGDAHVPAPPANKLPRFIAHPFLPYAGRPNDQRIVTVHHDFVGDITLAYRTNSYGFVGEEFRTHKLPREIRIITLGGSTTWQMGIDPASHHGREEHSWPAVLQRRLSAQFPDRPVSVYNLAQDGYSSPMSLVNLALVGVNLQPDFVLSYDGINDMAQTFDYRMRTDYADCFIDYHEMAPIGTRWPRFLSHSRFALWLEDRLQRIGDGSAASVPFAFRVPHRPDAFGGSFWNSAGFANLELLERNLRTMRGICREYNAVFIAATMHYFERDRHRDEFNARLRDFFTREQIPYFDADVALPKGDRAINTDQVHFTRQGAERMADGFSDEIVRQLRAGPRAATRSP